MSLTLMTPALCLLVALTATPNVTIHFVGNEQLDERTLLSTLDEREGFRSVNDDATLARDGHIVLAAYYDHGFVEAAVTAQRTLSADGAVTATFVIHEGPAYEIGFVRIEDDGLGVAPPVPSAGVRVDRSALVLIVQHLRDAYRTAGYDDVEVISSADIDAERRILSMTMRVVPGPRR